MNTNKQLAFHPFLLFSSISMYNNNTLNVNLIFYLSVSCWQLLSLIMILSFSDFRLMLPWKTYYIHIVENEQLLALQTRCFCTSFIHVYPFCVSNLYKKGKKILWVSLCICRTLHCVQGLHSRQALLQAFHRLCSVLLRGNIYYYCYYDFILDNKKGSRQRVRASWKVMWTLRNEREGKF